MPKGALVVANLGTPRAPDEAAVRAFLGEFLADPAVVDLPRWLWLPLLRGLILRRRPARVAAAYGAIWRRDGSPLAVETERIAAGLAARLGPEWEVVAAYRYGAPSAAGEVARLARSGAGRIVVLALFPQRTGATTGTLEEAVRRAAEREGAGGRLAFVAPPCDGPGYVAALAARVREALPNGPDGFTLLTSFHGLPVRFDRREGGRYAAECRRTSEALRAALDWPRERTMVCYQSRFGPGRWLEPATDRTLAALPAQGTTRVAVATPGFVADGLETLEEIGIRGAETFAAAGGEAFVRVPAPADHPALLDEWAGLALGA